MGLTIKLWLVTLLVCLLFFPGRMAEASVNLPLHHWAYEAIERLTALGLIDQAMLTAKPYSRKQAAKYVARAIERIRTDKVNVNGLEAVAGPLLMRVIEFLRPELSDLAVMPDFQRKSVGPIRYGGRLQLEGDAFFVGKETVRLRENRKGQYYANGIQAQADFRGWLELTDVIALSADPKFISNQHALGKGATDNSRNFYFQELNAKFTIFNFAFEIGRSSLWWGPGYHGSLLLTDHAFPLDMVQLGSDEPFRLPWVLRSLGQWKVNTFLAQLERDRDFPRAKVFGLRVSYLPADWLELGFTRLTQFDGRGRDQPFPRTVLDAYFFQPNWTGEGEVNEQAMLDVRIRVPRVPYLVPFPSGVQVYGELAGEDRWAWFGSRIRAVPRGPAFLAGVYIPQVFKDDTTDFRVEYADTVVGSRERGASRLWYNHSTYLSGMRFRGFPLGHHMGTDAQDLFIRTTRNLTDEFQLGLNVNLQRRGILESPGETKREAALDLTWWMSSKMQFTVGYTFQLIKNPGQITSINPFVETFPPNVTSTNHFLWTNLSVQF